MKNILIIIFTLLALISLGQATQRVPDTHTFKLSDVRNTVGEISLRDNFTTANTLNASNWDSRYSGTKTMDSNFRNYGLGSLSCGTYWGRSYTFEGYQDYNVNIGSNPGLYVLHYTGYWTGGMTAELYQNDILKDATYGDVLHGSFYGLGTAAVLTLRPLRFIYDPAGGQVKIRCYRGNFSVMSECPVINTLGNTYTYNNVNPSFYYTGLTSFSNYKLTLGVSPSRSTTITVWDASQSLTGTSLLNGNYLRRVSGAPTVSIPIDNINSIVIDIVMEPTDVETSITAKLELDFTQPILTTNAVTNLAPTTATSGGTFTRLGSSSITDRGILIGSSGTTPTLYSYINKYSLGTGGDFTQNISSLSPNTGYSVRAYVSTVNGDYYGDVKNFTTPILSAPLVDASPTIYVYDCNHSSLTGNVSSDGGSTVTERGFIYATSNTNLVIGGAGVTKVTATGTTGIMSAYPLMYSGTTYYAKAYAINAVGTTYSTNYATYYNAITYASLNDPMLNSKTYNSASVSFNVTDAGCGNISGRGIIYSTSTSNFTLGQPGVTVVGSQPSVGDVTYSLTGLGSSTTYYAKAYVQNEAGTKYSTNYITFTTDAPPVFAPTVGTVTASQGSGCNYADFSSTVSSDGGSAITERGFVYSSSYDPPSIGAGTTVTVSGTTGSMSASSVVLFAGTTYYIRAYAKNAIGTSYSSNTATYYRAINLPTVSNVSLSSYSYNSATLASNITDNGCGTLSTVGICYIQGTGTPTSSNNPNTVYPSTGAFSVNLSGLSASTQYTARAYAINAAGTQYSSNFSFTTSAAPKNVTASYSIQTTTSTSVIVTWFVNIAGGATSATTIPITITNASGSGSTTYNASFAVNQTQASPTTITYTRNTTSYTAYGTLGTMPTGYIGAGDASTTIPAK